MRMRSVYEVVCDCGETCQSEQTAVTCPNCKATFRIQWSEEKETESKD